MTAQVLTEGEILGFSLTRSWFGTALIAVLMAALAVFLFAVPVQADDVPVDPGIEETIVPLDPVPEIPVVEVPEEPAQVLAPVEPPPAPVDPVQQAPIVEDPPVPNNPLEPPSYVEPPAYYVEPAPVIEAPAEEPLPEPTQEPAPEATPKASNSPAPAETVVEKSVTKTAATDGISESSPLYMRLILIMVLMALGTGYYKFMGNSGRRIPTSNSVITNDEQKSSPDA